MEPAAKVKVTRMGRGSTVALAAAALLVSLPMLLVWLRAADPYEQETCRMFAEWKAKYRQTYRYTGEEECRYAVFKETRRRVARVRAAGVNSGLNSLAATASEEIYRGHGVRKGERSYEKETRQMFVEWKAEYGKSYRDAGEEECRYRLFKGNRRLVVRLNNAAAAARQNVYGLNQFGDLTNEEVRELCSPEIMEDRELSDRCQAATHDPDLVHGRLIRYQVCRCIVTELKQTESR